MPSDSARRQRDWHLAAVVALVAAAPLNMWGWVERDIVPYGDHAGYAAVVQQVWSNLAHYGRMPSWLPEHLGGTSNFTSHLKEFIVLPLAQALDPIRGSLLALAVCKTLAAVALYALLVALFRAPAAALVAAYAYGFGTIANHRSALLGHLDILLSYVLYPLMFAAALQCLRSRRRCGALVLGALVALQLHVSSLPGLVLPLMIALLWAMRPWRRSPGPRAPSPQLTGFWRQVKTLGLALGVFAVLSASQIVWLALDAEHHAFHAPWRIEQGREHFVLKSPFLLINRANWLGPWLQEHGLDALDLGSIPRHTGEHVYLGGVALACIAGAAALLRRAPGLRGWYAFFGVLFAIQYWLAMGSYSLLWQIAQIFHWPASAEIWTGRALLAAGAGCAAAAAWLAARRRHTRAVKPLLWAATAAAATSTSAFDALESALPLLRGVRAPYHFFDLAPFAFYAWFGVSLAAIAEALRSRALRAGCLALIALLVVLDYAPSRASHEQGVPAAPLREMAAMLREREVEEPPERLGITIRSWTNRTQSSLVAALGGMNTAWTWLGWQGSQHWRDYYLHVHRNLVGGERGEAPVRQRDALARAGRVRWVLQELADRKSRSLPAPWRRVASNERFVLWEQPRVYPPAMGMRAYLLSLQNSAEQDLDFSERLIPRRVAVISVSDPASAEFGALLRDAALFNAPAAAEALLDPAQRRQLSLASERLRRMDIERRSTIPVAYSRPAPEHIALDLDAGGEAALAFVSESHHPWWHASVDGDPAPVLRACGAFLAVPVGPGPHRVDLRFRRPPLVWAADALSAAAWVACVAGSIFWAIRTRRGYQRPEPGTMASRGSRIG